MPDGTTLEQRILNRLREFRLCEARRHHGTSHGRKGEPDIIGSYAGFSFVIEVKSGGAKASDLQLRRLSEWEKAGAYAVVVREDFEVRSFLRQVAYEGCLTLGLDPGHVANVGDLDLDPG